MAKSRCRIDISLNLHYPKAAYLGFGGSFGSLSITLKPRTSRLLELSRFDVAPTRDDVKLHGLIRVESYSKCESMKLLSGPTKT